MTPAAMSFQVSDLRDHRGFCNDVADRVWRAWWRHKGITLDYIGGRVEENLRGDAIPFCMVAHDGNRFLGTASVIASDLDERPEYTPWVAAVWVDPSHRRNGIGAALVRTAASETFKRGFERAYLCALPAKVAFYEGLGWTRTEDNVNGHGLSVLSHSTAQ